MNRNPRPTLRDLLVVRKKDGSRLKIIFEITSHGPTASRDLATLLLDDDSVVRKLRRECKDDNDAFVRKVFDIWLNQDDDDSTRYTAPCTWEELCCCIEDTSGLPQSLTKEIRNQFCTHDSESQSATTPTATPISTDTTTQRPDAAATQNRNLVKQYIERQGSLPVRSMKSFLIGPPCVGKTSACRRLTGEIKHISRDEIVPSTGIDAPLTVQLHHPTEHSSLLLSEGWRSQGLEKQCHALCRYIYALKSSATPPVFSKSRQVAASRRATTVTVTATQDAVKTTHDTATHDTATAAQDELTTALTTLVKDDDWKSIRDFLKNVKELDFLNIVDIGGQPEFHEILPLLLHGLALNLIFLNTTKDLDSPYTVEYRGGTGSGSLQYKSESTIREVIQRALCTISSLQTSDLENKSAAILIGTYCTDESAVLALDQSIQESFKEAYFMKNDVLCAVNKPGEKRRYIHGLDNVSGDPSEIDELRQLISTIVHERFTPVMVPTSALLLHLILRMKFGHTRGWCTLKECIEIAKNCGISEEDLLHEDGILQYLHDNFGTILYYRKVKKLCLRVIVNTNVIMGPPSRLFLLAFGAVKTEQQTAEHIRVTGEISLYLMKKVCSPDDDASDDDIPTDEIVELLKARYIIFEYLRLFSNEPVYFMPALLYPDHNVAKDSSNPDLLSSLLYPPVVFLPSSGDVPLGQFPATAVNLSKHWKPDGKNRYRNRIRFYAKCKGSRLLHVELRTLSTHLEFRVLSKPSTDTSLMVESIQKLWKVFAEVSSLYSHTQRITWSVGFYCPHSLQSGRQPHTATCISIDNPQEMICSHDGGLIPLSDKHKSWFTVMPIINTTATTTTTPIQELNADNVLYELMEHEFSPDMWERLAVGLKLSHAVSEINADHQTVYSKLIALVNRWVANDPDKSWNKLVSAIKMSGQKVVADKLAQELGLRK